MVIWFQNMLQLRRSHVAMNRMWHQRGSPYRASRAVFFRKISEGRASSEFTDNSLVAMMLEIWDILWCKNTQNIDIQKRNFQITDYASLHWEKGTITHTCVRMGKLTGWQAWGFGKICWSPKSWADSKKDVCAQKHSRSTVRITAIKSCKYHLSSLIFGGCQQQ